MTVVLSIRLSKTLPDARSEEGRFEEVVREEPSSLVETGTTWEGLVLELVAPEFRLPRLLILIIL